ncbi:Vps62-related protein [Streptomyces sp. URMC 126]|uniref:Vps62-related protein n=1 Tax=Streptomyces sp. URMC 126 TaxID=3423401 RepID=UPI003F19C140
MPSFETFGDIDVRYSIDRVLIWSSVADKQQGLRPHINVWLPVGGLAVSAFRPLGTYAFTTSDIDELVRDQRSQTGRPMPLLRNRRNGEGPLARPVRYERVWRDKGSGAKLDGSAWRPIPPTGYVALGDMWWEGWDTAPPLNAVWCVKKEYAGRLYARGARVLPPLWNDRGFGSDADVAVCGLDAPPTSVTDTKERLFLPAQYTTTVNHYGVADPTPSSWILELPADVDKRPFPRPPRLTSFDKPEEPTPVTDRIVRVPCTAVNDTERSEEWKVRNSPFYTIHRQVGWEVAVHADNRNGENPTDAGSNVKTGFSKEEGKTFTEKTTIEINVSAGISYKALSVGASVNITREIGYERRVNVAEFEEASIPKWIRVSQRASGVMWVPKHHLEVYRADGTLVGDETLSFRVNNSYVVDAYPPGASAIEIDPPDTVAADEFAQAPDIDWETGKGLPRIDITALAEQFEQDGEQQPS